MSRTSQLTPVSKARPCPVCGGDHKCSTAPDGLILCGRRDGPEPGFRHLGPCKDGQWHKYREGASASASDSDSGKRRAGSSPLPTDTDTFHRLAHEYAAALTPSRRAELAGRLGLPVEVLHRMPVGWNPGLGAWTFPESNGLGAVVGITVRYPDGTKRAVPGSRRGLTLVGGWADDPNPVFVVEGPTDCLVLAAVGLSPVGRPSNTGGADDLTLLLADQPKERPVVVVGENDRKPDGQWPGRDGAKAVAEKLTAALGRPVLWAMPPADYKDVREWVADRLAGMADGTDLIPVGDDIARALVGAAEHVRKAVALVSPRRFPVPIPATMLKRPGPNGVAWVWDGFLAKDGVTLLSALPKCGKTTLLAHLLAALPAGGSFCGRQLSPGRAVVVSEEPEGVWADRAAALGLTDAIRVIPRGGFVKGTFEEWAGFLADLGEQLQADPADLIVFDTLANLWPVKDENSAADVGAALAPLHRLTAGRSILLVHHLRKSDGAEGTGSRGSGALVAFIDVALELRRAKKGSADPKGCRRVLTGYGRYDAIPTEWTVELVPGEDGKPGGFRHKPDGGADDPRAGMDATRRAVLDLLADGEARTRDQIWGAVPAELRVNRKRFESVLEAETPRLWRKRKRDGQGGGFVYQVGGGRSSEPPTS